MASLALGASDGFAQSSDALIDKLVEKGVLSVTEGDELREEVDKDFNKAYSVKSGMPEWVTSLKLNGDVRGRYENFSDYGPLVDRHRFRYRLRFGAIANLTDNLEVGLRLTSSEPASGGVGGDPISGNQTFQDNGSKKSVYIDLAYGKWSPEYRHVGLSLTVGKMLNPFVFSDMVFDQDYTPEGLAQEFRIKLPKDHTLRFIAGQFALDESSGSSNDPWLFGAQIRLDSPWSEKIKTSLGVAALHLYRESALTTPAVPNQSSGNSRNAAGALTERYNPVVVDASVTYTLPSFPMYAGPFPISVIGDFMHNPAASQNNDAYSFGAVIGKSGKKGTWDLSYRYKVLEGDAWYEELPDSDFGAIYRATGPRNTDGTGYRSGTNVRGHILKAGYSPYNAITFNVTYFITDLIQDPALAKIDGQVNRLQVDANWKF